MNKRLLIDFWIFGPERGCLMREIPVLRELQKLDVDFRLFVHQTQVQLLKASFPGFQGEIIPYPEGSLLVYTNKFDIDVLKTLQSLLRYSTITVMKHYYLFMFYLRKRRPALVINDFLPFTPLFCRIGRIPVFGVYNYNLSYTRLGTSPIYKLLSIGIRFAYSIMYILHQKIFIEQVYPSHKTDSRTIAIPIIARRPTRTVEQVKLELAQPDSTKLIFLSLGGGATESNQVYLDFFHSLSAGVDGKFVIIPRSLKETKYISANYPNFICTSYRWVETQDIINAASLVITRAGFTTVAEALQSQVPLLLWHVEKHPEIRETEQLLIKNKLAAGSIGTGDNPDKVRKMINRALSDAALKTRLKTVPSGGEMIVISAVIRELKARYPNQYYELEDNA